ncbi:MAG TPA: hypothetical protein VGP73_21005 [Thermoanaerobaculia bacterium]
MSLAKLLGRSAALRGLSVLALGSSMTAAAVLSAALPVRVISRVLLWPVSIMLWIFPAPCFDRGPGEKPFCEGTPIQLLAGGFGLIVTWAFYLVVAHVLIRRFSRRPDPDLSVFT